MRMRLIGTLIFYATLLNGAIVDGGVVPGTAFHRYSTEDRFRRTIAFYLSASSAEGPAPLAVFVQGTGCSSHFERRGGRIAQGTIKLLNDVARGRARILAVEKPGVQFLDTQPDAADARTYQQEFLVEHTLDRWTEAVVASIGAAHGLPGVDRRRTLVIGGSEGGVVAVHVSNVLESVTHVASIAGGGPNHLFAVADYQRQLQFGRPWMNHRRSVSATCSFSFSSPARVSAISFMSLPPPARRSVRRL